MIDLEEAKGFLPPGTVREPNDAEKLLEAELAQRNIGLYYPEPNAPSVVECLNPLPQPDSNQDDRKSDGIPRNAERVPAEATGRDMEDRPETEPPIRSPDGHPATH